MKPYKMANREGMAPVTLAVSQPPYLPLKIARVDLEVETNVDENSIAFSEWEPTEEEARILGNGGRIELALWLSGMKFPPVRIKAIGSDASRRLSQVAPSVDWEKALKTATEKQAPIFRDDDLTAADDYANLKEAFKLLFAGRTIRSTFAEPTK